MYLRDRKPEDKRNRSDANSVAQSFRLPTESSSFFDNRSVQSRANETIASNAGVIQRYEKIGVNEDVQQDVDNGDGPVNYAWKAKFTVRLPTRPKDEQVVSCSIKLSTNANKSEVAAWNLLTQKVWNDKFAIKFLGKTYPIRVSLKKVRRSADQKVNAVRSKESSSGGGFGTEDMGEWGTNDTSEIPHEVGHMLGNLDEYGQVTDDAETLDHGDFDSPDLVHGSEGESLMHNTSAPVRRRNFELIHNQVKTKWATATLIKFMG